MRNRTEAKRAPMTISPDNVAQTNEDQADVAGLA